MLFQVNVAPLVIPAAQIVAKVSCRPRPKAWRLETQGVVVAANGE